MAETKELKAARAKAWYAKNKARHQVHTHRWYQENKVRALAQQKVRAEKPENKRRSMWHNVKHRAKRTGIPFTIPFEAIVWPTHCPALGVRLDYGRKRGSPVPNSPSLDRIKPSLGYVEGNVAVLSMRANLIKQNATADEVHSVALWMRSLV